MLRKVDDSLRESEGDCPEAPPHQNAGQQRSSQSAVLQQPPRRTALPDSRSESATLGNQHQPPRASVRFSRCEISCPQEPRASARRLMLLAACA